jgi:hypothetical protein
MQTTQRGGQAIQGDSDSDEKYGLGLSHMHGEWHSDDEMDL